ncbi:MAG: membrane protein insertase YidC [Candidatus Eisenbacteria bacterium]|uniref:Membrane protein insertase YidC n=1 Tax=Eiseniibacteriota bacterium TaxID=2212470 RepID=A0A849SW11_UNCEI|nr:membrane protein insertase YidC [Candidatus Eisenbacteria bacterium]
MMDRRTWIAVGLCVVFLFAYPQILKVFGLQQYLNPGAPKPPVADSAQVSGNSTGLATGIGFGTPDSAGSGLTPAGTATSTSAAPPTQAQLTSLPFRPVRSEIERNYAIETPLYRATFTNRGARLLAVELKRYSAALGAKGVQTGRAALLPRNNGALAPEDRVVLAGGPSVALDLGAGDAQRSLSGVVYTATESLDASGALRSLAFTTYDSTGLFLRQTWRARPDDYALDLEVEMRGVPANWRLSNYSVTAQSWPLLDEYDYKNEHSSLRATALIGTNLQRVSEGQVGKGPKVFDGNVQWVAVQTRYFMGGVAVVRGSAQSAVAHSVSRPISAQEAARMPADQRSKAPVLANTLVMGMPGETDPLNRFRVYFGPNEFSRLAKLGLGLERIVDLGWSWVQPFSKGLLYVLNVLNSVVRNYGVAILLLASLVRLLLHPLNMMSIRSMRSMQKIQPEVERLRKKYEKDATAMNTAIMALYKEHKVNPAGGCLPMLVQMPFFIALYSVLYNAIELRHAPFVAWVHDLSSPDVLAMVGPFPLRLLPILMTLAGLLSQRLTPTDPRQAPTMYLMNVMMLVFFYNLPSGLVLYWTVMNLLTALQQWLALREDGGSRGSETVVRMGSAK